MNHILAFLKEIYDFSRGLEIFTKVLVPILGDLAKKQVLSVNLKKRNP